MRFWLWAPTMECRGTPKPCGACLRAMTSLTFIFINKIDLENPGRDVLLAQLGQRLSEGCLDANELLAGGARLGGYCCVGRAALEEFLEVGELSVATLSRMVAERKLFPCFAGSALKGQGVDELLDGICALMREQAWLPEFAARVYRVSRGGSRRAFGLG